VNEIARLGVSVPTGELKDGAAALRAIVPAAKQAEASVNKFNAAAQGLAGLPGKAKPAASGMEQVAAAARGVTGATNGMSRAVLGAGTHLGSLGAAAAGAAFQTNVYGQAMTRVSAQTAMADAHIIAYRNSLSKVPAAATAASSSLNRLGAAANDNINRLQQTPGNIAAQFQDIGVTAAGGMQPWLIALQQGTQLSAALQGGVGNLIAGLRQLFNMTAILTIGFVAVLAALIQMVDWMSVAETVVVGLAEFVERYSDVLLVAGAMALIAFGPTILSAVVSLAATIGGALVTAVSTATLAMISFALANPFTAIAVAIAVAITAMVALNDTFGGVFTNFLKVVEYVANAIINFFATAFNAIVILAESTINGLIGAFEGFSSFLGFDVSVGRVDLSGVKIDTSQGRDFVGDIAGFVSDLASQGVAAARGLFAPEDVVSEAASGGRGGTVGRGGQTDAEREAQAYSDLTARARARITELQNEATALTMTGQAARMFRNEQELLAQATERGIALDAARRREITALAQEMTNAQIAVQVQEATNAYNEQMIALRQQSELIGLTGRALEEAATYQELLNDAINNSIPVTDAYNQLLRERATAITAQTEANRSGDFMADFTRNTEMQTFALQRQRGELGLVGPALEAYRIESDLLVEAMRRGVELSSAQVESARRQALGFAELSDEIQRQTELTEMARDAIDSLFGDMYRNLRQGQSVWQAFGNVVMSVVDSIIQQLLRLAAQSAFRSLVGALGGGGPQAGLLGSANSTIDSNPGLFAKGGAFDGSVQMFAKGGAFTNGIYSNPTMFKFANGGAFGMMGEAGPEAVMPLKRGSDGSLGVQVQAAEPQLVVVRVTSDDERFNAYVDTRIDAQAPTIAQAGSEINQRDTAFVRSRRLA